VKVGEIWVQKDNGSRWKIIGMGGGYAFWNPEVHGVNDITELNDEGVTIECVESKPSVKGSTPEERLLQDIFGDKATHDVGYIYEIARSAFIKYYKKEYS